MPLGWAIPGLGGEEKKEPRIRLEAPNKGAFDINTSDDFVSPALARYIYDKWQKTSESEKMTLVSQRARRGIRCHICGKSGYYRSICPNACISPPPTPDSMASTPPGTPPPSPPGLGVLWGSLGFDAKEYSEEKEQSENPKKHVPLKADLGPCREDATERKEDLRVADFGIGGFEFFAHADEGYNRSLPELTLHQVLRRLMRLLERSLKENAAKLEAKIDVTLLHPPNEEVSENFYTDALAKIKEHRDYFVAKRTKNERNDRKMYKFQGNYRTDDKLHGLFRGQGDGMQDKSLFKVDPKAGQSMHARIGWKSVLAKHDQLAISDPNALAKAEEVEKMFAAQGAWTAKQKADMEHRNDRYEHMWFVIKTELAKEHERETKELKAYEEGAKVSKRAKMDTWLDRLNSIDNIMFMLKEYKIVGALDEADLLVYQVEKWSEEMKNNKTTRKQRPRANAKKGATEKPSSATTMPAAPDHEAQALVAELEANAATRNNVKKDWEEELGVDGERDGFDNTDVFAQIAQAVHMESNKEPSSSKPGTAASRANSRKGKKGKNGDAKKDSSATAGGNVMMSAGASPYYESDIALERHAKFSQALSRHWKIPEDPRDRKRRERKEKGGPGPAVQALIDESSARSPARGNSRKATQNNRDPLARVRGAADIGMPEGSNASTPRTARSEDSLAYSSAGEDSGDDTTVASRGTLGTQRTGVGSERRTTTPGGSTRTRVTLTKKGNVRINPNSRPTLSKQVVKKSVVVKPDDYEKMITGQQKRTEMGKALQQKYLHHNNRMPFEEVDEAVQRADKEAEDVIAAAERKRLRKTGGWKPPNIQRVEVIPPHEIDNMKMQQAKKEFINAGLKNNIRKGVQTDLAWAVPSLIPVPGAFEGDDTERLSSHTGAQIVDGLQEKMTSDLGHTERRLLPLYVRNTLIEVNGTSANGDQSQDVLSQDRRYSHYHGRPLVRFEPGKELVDSKAFLKEKGRGFGSNKKAKEDKLAPLIEERRKKAEQERIAKQRYQPMNRSLVRLVFGKPAGNPQDLLFANHAA
jgi:hypothetical protein